MPSSFDNLFYRPAQEQISRETEQLEADVIQKLSNLRRGDIKPDDRIPSDVAEMNREEKNNYILDFNRGRISPTLPNTIRVVEVLMSQAEDVATRANEIEELIASGINPISTENAPRIVFDAMRLLYGEDVDTSQITMGQIQCAASVNSTHRRFVEENQTTPDSALVEDFINDEASPLHLPGVPQNRAEFEDMMRATFNDDNLFEWDVLTFLVLLLKVVLETVILFLFKPICKITIIGIPIGKMLAAGLGVEWYEEQVGTKKDGTAIMWWKFSGGAPFPGPITVLGKIINKDLTCESIPDLDIDIYWRSRIEEISRQARRGNIPNAEEVAADLSGDGANTPSDADPTPSICSDPTRQPTVHEIAAAQTILNYATEQTKLDKRDKTLNDLQGMLACAGAQEECVVFSASCGNMHDKLSMVRIGGDGAASLPQTETTWMGKANSAVEGAVVGYIQTMSETLRNIDLTVSSALELKFLGERWKDTICCFVRLLYALFIGNDGFKVGDENKSIQEYATDWQAQYEEQGQIVAQKVKALVTAVDALLSAFTTTVSTNFNVKLGDFSIPQLGQFIISILRKTIFEALVTINDYLFGGLRKMVFGAINAMINQSEELAAALADCVLFNILINWIQCLLNFLQNLILEQLQKIRGESDAAWGDFEVSMDFAFQNKQVTFLSDLLQVIADWAFQIVTICNINNIRQEDAFIELIENITTDLGMRPYEDDETSLRYGNITENMITSVMRAEDDHSRLQDSNTRNYMRRDKGEYGMSYKTFTVVDQTKKTSDNKYQSDKKSRTDTERSSDSASTIRGKEQENVVLPSTLTTSKEEFVRKCSKAYNNINGILANDKKLRDMFNRVGLYRDFGF